MKIRRICAYRVELPLREGSYRWSGGKAVSVFDSTVVRVDTDEGVTGYGEVCPLGPFYLPAYANGVRAGIAELGPHLLGADPLALLSLQRRMDAALKGHPYVKSKAAGLPVCTLLGGRHGDDFVLYRAISQDTPEAMAGRVAAYRAEGYRRFQLKVGGDPAEDIERIRAAAAMLGPGDRLVADANTGWLMHDALRVVRAVRDVDVYVEQPCPSYEECLSVRRHTDHPFILDEVVDSVDVLYQDQQIRRPDQGEASARLVHFARHRHDAGGQLGRRRRDGGDRPPGPQHAPRVVVHRDRLQQLRHGEHRRRGAAARQRPDGGPHRSGVGRQPPRGRAGHAGARGGVILSIAIRPGRSSSSAGSGLSLPPTFCRLQAQSEPWRQDLLRLCEG